LFVSTSSIQMTAPCQNAEAEDYWRDQDNPKDDYPRFSEIGDRSEEPISDRQSSCGAVSSHE
jgi:hypothetical protein